MFMATAVHAPRRHVATEEGLSRRDHADPLMAGRTWDIARLGGERNSREAADQRDLSGAE